MDTHIRWMQTQTLVPFVVYIKPSIIERYLHMQKHITCLVLESFRFCLANRILQRCRTRAELQKKTIWYIYTAAWHWPSTSTKMCSKNVVTALKKRMHSKNTEYTKVFPIRIQNLNCLCPNLSESTSKRLHFGYMYRWIFFVFRCILL